jgi:membrane fusion protein (multidrug efflux system)
MVLVALSMLLTACSPLVAPSTPDPAPRPRTAVKTVRVARGDVTSLLVYPGELRPKRTTVVMSRVAGRLLRVHVEPGVMVREGDVVVELDRAALEVQSLQAQAGLAGAEARLAGLRAGEDVEARAEAEAMLRAARTRLAALEAGPPTDSLAMLAHNLREARRRLAELEGDRPAAVVEAETRLFQARARLDEIFARPTASPTPLDGTLLDRARGEVRQAELELMRSRQPASAEDLAAARQSVADAEDALLLARSFVSPADLEEARAQVEAAEARLRRADAAPSSAALQAAESAVQYAWANLELARLQLRESTIVAPSVGLVLDVHQPQGANVAVGTPLLTLQPPEYEIHVAVDERHLGQVRSGLGVSVTVDAYPGESFAGAVRSVAPALDARTRTVATRIDVADPQGKLKAGMIGQAAIAGDRHSGALVLPREAVMGSPDASVFQVLDGRARRLPVKLGLTDGRSVEVVQGLGEGMEVVANPAGIGDGDLVSER